LRGAPRAPYNAWMKGPLRILARRVLPVLLVAMAAAAVGSLCHDLLFIGRFYVVKEGVLYRCRQPEGLQWTILKRYGIKTVVNLRFEEEDPKAFAEEKDACAKAGAKFVNIPVGGIPPSEEKVRAFLRQVGTSAPVLVHCAHGRNRTSSMAAAYRVVFEGWDAQKALAEMADTGAELEGDKARLCLDLLTMLQDNRQKYLRKALSTGPAAHHATSSATSRSQDGTSSAPARP